MAAFDYAALAADAAALIEEFGSEATVRRTPVTVDNASGAVTPGTPQTQALQAVVLPASGGTLEAFDVRFMSDVNDGTDVRFCIMAALGAAFQPEPKDEVDLLGETWQVMGCTPLNVNGTALIYSVGLKRP